ncbi:MAG: tetratricopeptide (TPR) repeat protein [Myxococcota bacterium]|jgi:tetratricopeptide (TPR) repeat protein
MRWLIASALLASLLVNVPASAQDDLPAEVPALTDEERAEAMAGYVGAISTGDKDGAAVALLALVDDPAMAPVHGEAWLALAGLTKGAGFEHAQLHALSRAIELDGASAAGKLADAVALADSVGDDEELAAALAGNIGLQMDPMTRAAVSFVTARWHLRQGNLGEAVGLLYTVTDTSSPYYTDSRNLLGVVLTQQGKPKAALEPFQEAKSRGRSEDRGDRFDNLVDLNLARAFFTAKNWGQAIYYYAQVDRGSEFWPQAQFERAWAHFRADDMTGALALLMNHESPFFDEWYFAEGSLLRAYSLFMMCKFPDAGEAIEDFVAKYTPMKEDLDSALATLTPEDAFEDARAVREGRKTRIPAGMLGDIRFDDRISDAIDTLESIDAELSTLGNASGPLAERALQWLEARRGDIVAEQGERVLSRSRMAQVELAEMLTGIEITRLDLLTLEAQMLERASVTGTLEFGDNIGRLRDMKKKQKRKWVWPFQGEYWADELGWYRIDTRPDCPDNMANGE